jgi:NADH-quinone oxidoreductase subunit I
MTAQDYYDGKVTQAAPGTVPQQRSSQKRTGPEGTAS